MPSVLADSEDQEKLRCFMYSISVFLKDPIRNTEVFLLLSFKPDIDLKASNILISSLNDLREPSSANVASSAKRFLFQRVPGCKEYLGMILRPETVEHVL